MVYQEPGALQNADAKTVKVSLSDLLTGDEDKSDVIYRALEKSVGGKGVGFFEEMLRFVNLHGRVPESIKKNVLLARR